MGSVLARLQRVLGTVLPALLLGACAAAVTTTAPELAERAATVEVFYGTDRARAEEPGEFYGHARGEVEYGRVLVEVPLDDALLDLGRLSVTRLDLTPDARHRLRIDSIEPLEERGFFDRLSTAVGESGDESVIVFIHGYKRSFEDAVKAGAQLKLRLGYQGVLALWSWPSRNQAAGYVADYTNADWSRPHLAGFLAALSERSGASRIHIVAHSMGGRLIAEALAAGSRFEQRRYPQLGEVVLLAPDVDAAIFERDLAPWLERAGIRTTLYASSNDAALRTSRTLHAYPRAGDTAQAVVVVPGVETVDVSTVNRSVLGHRYFEKSTAVIEDLSRLLRTGQRAADRPGLTPVDSPAGRVWAIGAAGP